MKLISNTLISLEHLIS